jgi:hypothetical protein
LAIESIRLAMESIHEEEKQEEDADIERGGRRRWG